MRIKEVSVVDQGLLVSDSLKSEIVPFSGIKVVRQEIQEQRHLICLWNSLPRDHSEKKYTLNR